MTSRLVSLIGAACVLAACHSDSDLVGDWFRCGNLPAPDSSCGDGIHLVGDYTWNEIEGDYSATGTYLASRQPERSGNWSTDWSSGGSVQIWLTPTSGARFPMTDMHYSLEGDLLVGPPCLMDCSGRPIHWYRVVPSRLAGLR